MIGGLEEHVSRRPSTARLGRLGQCALVVASALAPCTRASQWIQTLGGVGDDELRDVTVLPDGRAVAVGYTTSAGAGGADVLAVGLARGGAVDWQETLGGANDEDAFAVRRLLDGRLLVGGATSSWSNGLADAWWITLDSAGSVPSQLHAGVGLDDTGYGACAAPDGGFAASSVTRSGAGGSDFWVTRVDASGGLSWQVTLGGVADEEARDIVATDDDGDGASDDGFLLVGSTTSYGSGGEAGWVVKLDTRGVVAWERVIDALRFERVAAARDGSFLLVGSRNDGGFWASAAVVVRLEATGDVRWRAELDEDGDQWGWGILEDETGDIVVAGGTSRPGTDGQDAFVTRLRASGQERGGVFIGGPGSQEARGIAALGGGEFLVAGWTDALDGSRDALLARVSLPFRRACGLSYGSHPESIWRRPPTLPSTAAVGVPSITFDPSFALATESLLPTTACVEPCTLEVDDGTDQDGSGFAAPLRVARDPGSRSDVLVSFEPIGTASTCHAYRGTIAAFAARTYDHVPALGGCSLQASPYRDVGAATDGVDVYYLIVPSCGLAGEGSLGRSSRGVERPHSDDPSIGGARCP